MKRIFLVLMIWLLIPSYLYSAEKLFEYGFEVGDDWDGEVLSAEGYPITSSYEGYMAIHEAATDIVSSYYADEMNQTWTPHSGNYFLLQNDSSNFLLDPPVPGITEGVVNAHNNIGLASEHGGNNPFNIETEITTGEIFLRYWIRTNKGFAAVPHFPGVKWVRFSSSDGNNDNRLTLNLQTKRNDPAMLMFMTNEGGWLSGEGGPPYFFNAYDGNWHKFSYHIDWNEGTVRIWYDVHNETLDNVYDQYIAPDGRLGSGTGPRSIVIKSNFAAHEPTEETYHAVDDIEIWDGIPDDPQVPTDSSDLDSDGDDAATNEDDDSESSGCFLHTISD